MEIVLEICSVVQSIMFGSILGHICIEIMKKYKNQKDSENK